MSRHTAFPRLTVFNRDDHFIFRKKVRVHGKWYDDQDTVPKEHFTTRRLRLLYEQRMIQAVTLPDTIESKPDFTQLPTAAIKDFLKTNGCVARRGWLRAKLIEKADQLWEKNNGIADTKSDQE